MLWIQCVKYFREGTPFTSSSKNPVCSDFINCHVLKQFTRRRISLQENFFLYSPIQTMCYSRPPLSQYQCQLEYLEEGQRGISCILFVELIRCSAFVLKFGRNYPREGKCRIRESLRKEVRRPVFSDTFVGNAINGLPFKSSLNHPHDLSFHISFRRSLLRPHGNLPMKFKVLN